jgi:hypothetical protein
LKSLDNNKVGVIAIYDMDSCNYSLNDVDNGVVRLYSTCKNSEFFHNKIAWFLMSNYHYRTENISIVDNTLGYLSIGGNNAAYDSCLKIIGNHFIIWGSGNGLLISNGGSYIDSLIDCVIDHNYFKTPSFQMGIILGGAPSAGHDSFTVVKRCRISNNEIYASNVGIQLDSLIDSTILWNNLIYAPNKVIDYGTNTIDYGLNSVLGKEVWNYPGRIVTDTVDAQIYLNWFNYGMDTLASGASADTILNSDFTVGTYFIVFPKDSIWGGHATVETKIDTAIIKSSVIEAGDRPYNYIWK